MELGFDPPPLVEHSTRLVPILKIARPPNSQNTRDIPNLMIFFIFSLILAHFPKIQFRPGRALEKKRENVYRHYTLHPGGMQSLLAICKCIVNARTDFV